MKREVRSQKREGRVFFSLQPSHFDLKTKTPSIPQNGNEGIQRVQSKTVQLAGLILLFAEKRPDTLGADECIQTGILTSASNLTPAFPSFRLVALGVCSRYSGATVPDSHRVPRHLTAIGRKTFPAGFKERFFLTPK
jgi:hypothetical protein